MGGVEDGELIVEEEEKRCAKRMRTLRSGEREGTQGSEVAKEKAKVDRRDKDKGVGLVSAQR